MNISEMPSPPTITSVTNEGASSSTGVDRVLYYGITKVQDGVESALSEVFIVNVRYPWVDGGIVRIKRRDLIAVYPRSWYTRKSMGCTDT